MKKELCRLASKNGLPLHQQPTHPHGKFSWMLWTMLVLDVNTLPAWKQSSWARQVYLLPILPSVHWPRHPLSELFIKCACVDALYKQLSPVVSHSSGCHTYYICIWRPPSPHSASCNTCALVNALVLRGKTPPVQVAAGDDHHECKWSIFASWWKEKHHQRKLHRVKTILGTSLRL